MDARSLLRAKKADTSARLTAPHATYTPAGQLRCSICAIAVNHWDSHTASKQHKQSLARFAASQPQPSSSKTKRPAVEPPIASSSTSKKLRPNSPGPSLPAPAPAPVPVPAPLPASAPAPPPTPADPALDDELTSFLTSLSSDPAPPAAPTSALTASLTAPAKKGYKISQVETQTSYEALPQISRAGAAGEGEGGKGAGKGKTKAEEEREAAEEEAERRTRAGREEREEIMDRLEEEARAQEDADDRVVQLKAKMEAFKKKRKEALERKGKGKSNGVAEGTEK